MAATRAAMKRAWYSSLATSRKLKGPACVKSGLEVLGAICGRCRALYTCAAARLVLLR